MSVFSMASTALAGCDRKTSGILRSKKATRLSACLQNIVVGIDRACESADSRTTSVPAGKTKAPGRGSKIRKLRQRAACACQNKSFCAWCARVPQVISCHLFYTSRKHLTYQPGPVTREGRQTFFSPFFVHKSSPKKLNLLSIAVSFRKRPSNHRKTAREFGLFRWSRLVTMRLAVQCVLFFRGSNEAIASWNSNMVTTSRLLADKARPYVPAAAAPALDAAAENPIAVVGTMLVRPRPCCSR